jgi:hypothetical protein
MEQRGRVPQIRPGPAAVSRAHDYEVPRYRVRRLPDERRWGRRRAVYEVEMTTPGKVEPEWVERTHHPESLLVQALGPGDAGSVCTAADRAWTGGVGPWESLYAGDRPGSDEPIGGIP